MHKKPFDGTKGIYNKSLIISKDNHKVYSPPFNIGGEKWEFHKNDEDPCPSVPHGHSRDGKRKLDIVTGYIYDVRTNKILRKANRKELAKLKTDYKFRIFARETLEIFINTNPIKDFNYPEWILINIVNPEEKE